MYINSAHSIIKIIQIKVKQLQPQCDATCETHIWKQGQRSQNVMSFSDICFHGLTLGCSSVLSICGATDYGD
jgi:hypothetical protein